MPVHKLRRFLPDPFSIAMVVAVIVATFLPVHGQAAVYFRLLTQWAVALLFFMNGARLARQAVIAGLTHWRLHLLVSAITFVVFPLVGVLSNGLLEAWLGPALALGFLYLCCLPSTVQSSVAFTSIAGGNVPAAICSATLSNLVAVFVTPALVGLLLSAHGGAAGLDAVWAIVEQLLLPFIAGQMLRPWVGDWIKKHAKLTGYVDRSSIVLVVYGAFSEAVYAGLWQSTPLSALLAMAAAALVLLAAVLLLTRWLGRKLGFNHGDQLVILFCGSKKSMASGVPMASILFPAAQVGSIVLPIMLFHQIQLMACAWIAKYYAEHKEAQ